MLQYQKFQPFSPRGFEDLKKKMSIYLFEKFNPNCSPNLFLVIIITITINQWLKLSLFLFERGLDPSLYKLEFLSPKNALSLACLNFNKATFGKKLNM